MLRGRSASPSGTRASWPWRWRTRTARCGSAARAAAAGRAWASCWALRAPPATRRSPPPSGMSRYAAQGPVTGSIASCLCDTLSRCVPLGKPGVAEVGPGPRRGGAPDGIAGGRRHHYHHAVRRARRRRPVREARVCAGAQRRAGHGLPAHVYCWRRAHAGAVRPLQGVFAGSLGALPGLYLRFDSSLQLPEGSVRVRADLLVWACCKRCGAQTVAWGSTMAWGSFCCEARAGVARTKPYAVQQFLLCPPHSLLGSL